MLQTSLTRGDTMAVAQTGTPLDAVIEHLGDEVEERHSPDWVGVMMAVAGAAVSVGLLIIGLGEFGEDGSRTVPLLISLLLIVVAYLMLAFWPFGDAALVRPAAIAILVPGIIGLGSLLFSTSVESVSARALLVAVLGLVAWFAPLSRGRPWLLALTLGGVWVAVLDASDGANLNLDVGAQGDSASSSGVVSVLFGLALLGVLYLLDKRGWHGAVATPFAAIGNAAFVVGVLAVLADIDSAAGVGTIVLVAGVLLVVIGSRGRHRRVTTWLGGLGVFAGLASYVGAIYDGGSTRVPGLLLALFGVILGAIAVFLSDPARRARFGSNSGGTPAPAPVAGGLPGAVPGGPVTGIEETVVQQAPLQPASSDVVAGWYPDPTQRHHERWWDGTTWTAFARTDGVDHQDPIG